MSNPVILPPGLLSCSSNTDFRKAISSEIFNLGLFPLPPFSLMPVIPSLLNFSTQVPIVCRSTFIILAMSELLLPSFIWQKAKYLIFSLG